MNKAVDENADQPAQDKASPTDADTREGAAPPSLEERRAERVARRKAAEAEMTWEEVRASRRARAAGRRERLAALPDELRAEREAELAQAKQARLSGRTMD